MTSYNSKQTMKEQKAHRITMLARELKELTKEFGWCKVWIGDELSVQVEKLPTDWIERKGVQPWSEYQYKYGLARNGVKIYFVSLDGNLKK